MEGVPDSVNYDKITEGLFAIKGVKEVDDLHIWSLTKGKVALTVHLHLESVADIQRILYEATVFLRKEKIYHSTIQCEDSSIEKGGKFFIDCAQDVHTHL